MCNALYAENCENNSYDSSKQINRKTNDNCHVDLSVYVRGNSKKSSFH